MEDEGLSPDTFREHVNTVKSQRHIVIFAPKHQHRCTESPPRNSYSVELGRTRPLPYIARFPPRRMGFSHSKMAKPEQISKLIGDAPGAPRTYPGADGDEGVRGTTSAGSMYGLLSRTADKHGEHELLGHRLAPGEGEFQFISYTETRAKVLRIATALMKEHGVQKGDRIGVYGKNCPAWAAIQYAINAAGAILVPIYDTLGAEIVEYVCNHAECGVVFVAEENFAKWDAAKEKCPTVKSVIRFDIGAVDSKKGEGSITELMEKGTEDASGLPEVGNDDLTVIMYTSGTTGNPKGVMLTNGNILASVGAAYHFFDRWGIKLTDTESLLSYLPLSHIFEQQAEALMVGRGGKIGYYSGNIKLLVADLDALKPTLFAGVPRVFARFQQKIEETVAAGSAIKKMLFNWAYQRQLQSVQNPGGIGRNALWDALIMNKVKAKILPRAKLIITGSAPMSAQTNDFLKVCLNAPVLQGYGLTETVGGMNCSAPFVSVSGTCGGPLPGTEVKLLDLPEMNYLSTNKPPQGEVCVRGPVVFKGYYKNEEATKGAFIDGWFRTGDVGQWNPDGSLQIIDRAKNLFKLSQGEYVSPEALEQEYAKAKLVLQIYVHGNSVESTLMAVVVPDAEHALPWGKKRGLDTLQAIGASEEFKKEVLAQLLEMHKIAKFKSYEKIRDIIIETGDLNELGQGFHVDNNLATPTFKLKRPQLRKKYKDGLDALYEKMKQ